jgi:NAD(P)-dependent dehydrogenase (short-subunit alcohol dehydrogenase family)
MVAGMRRAVVTGAGSGFGRAIATELAGRGYRVWATDVDAEAAARTAAEIGGDAESAELDVREESACRALAEKVAAEGGLDLWVNNAGVLFTGSSWEVGEAARASMLSINTEGAMNGTVAALERMVPAGRGHVINVVSLAGVVAAPGEVAYSASKHATLAFTVGTLYDLRRAGQKGIEVSAVCPDGAWPRCSKTGSTISTPPAPSPGSCSPQRRSGTRSASSPSVPGPSSSSLAGAEPCCDCSASTPA